ncbi:transporter substrate-binding domain-containing protein [Ruegeria jejuensis]|uniref:transporter substrate-binding domain-containing protein n=1 Tax=Ruegeria jejuensis TaxID=3233338 RepID=UPI00355B3EF4
MKFAYLIEPPFNYRDKDGTVTGCDVELARHVFQQLAIDGVEFVETEFAQLLPGLARGDWQMTTGLFASEDRKQHALFSRPIWALPDGLLVLTADASHIGGYRSLAQSCDLTVAVIRDQIQHQTLIEVGVAQNRIHVFETYTDAARAVQDQQVDAYASVARAHVGYVQQQDAQELTVVEVPSCEKPPEVGCFGISTSAIEFKKHIDQVLDQFMGSAAHLRLIRGFGFDEEDVSLVL